MTEHAFLTDSENRELLEQAGRLVTYLSKHLVCLAVNYVALDADGRPVDQVQFLACSGFVVVFHGSWFFVTAGHILKEDLDENVEAGRLRIINTAFADYFGPDARANMPTMFDYSETERFYVDDRAFGLDLGVMYLRPYLQRHLEANGVMPVSEENWLRQHQVAFDGFAVLGFPSQFVTSVPQKGDFGQEALALVQPTLVFLEKLAAMPEGVEESDLPWFIGKAKLRGGLTSMKGMSGAPILGWRVSPGQQLRYWIVALQSRWLPERRLVLGCPVPVFMGILEDSFQRFLAHPPSGKRFRMPPRPWTNNEKALLGKMPDRALARRLGRTAGAVRAMRGRLGIQTPRKDGRQG